MSEETSVQPAAPAVGARPAFATDVRVRYSETDADGVVYYANYLVYFEVARVELLRALGCPIETVAARGLTLPVVEVRARYLRPGRLDDLLTVAVFKGAVGRASFEFDYLVRRGDELLASGWTRLACVEAVSGRAVALPGWLRALFDRLPATEDTD
jgi:acyl-CoA thioester hydrolase